MATGMNAVFIERNFESSIDNVWNAWTVPHLIMNWFGSDPGGKVLKAKLDVRPGGKFEIVFQDSDLTEHTCSGMYNEVQEFSRLIFNWQWKSEPGVISLVTVLLIPEGRTTLMQFEHKNLGSGSRHNYAIGWQTTFSKLERMLNLQQ